MKNKKILIITVVILCLAVILGGCFLYLNKNSEKTVNIEQTAETSDKTLDEINAYQEKYFEIIKRHNALLNLNNDKDASKDLEELKSLFNEVKVKTDRNNEYFGEYVKIKEKYKNNNGETTLEMNQFAKQKYDAFDKLLNDVYGAVKSKISDKDFEKLQIQQRAWLKEVEDYNNVFEAQKFGTIGTLVKLDYEINMRSFRTLLLMMYL